MVTPAAAASAAWAHRQHTAARASTAHTRSNGPARIDGRRENGDGVTRETRGERRERAGENASPTRRAWKKKTHWRPSRSQRRARPDVCSSACTSPWPCGLACSAYASSGSSASRAALSASAGTFSCLMSVSWPGAVRPNRSCAASSASVAACVSSDVMIASGNTTFPPQRACAKTAARKSRHAHERVNINLSRCSGAGDRARRGGPRAPCHTPARATHGVAGGRGVRNERT